MAEEAERGTAKGRTFEELVHSTIEEIAQAQGDAAHHTGDLSTESGSKKGDSVVEIGGALGTPLATVVFEAKNKRLSKNDAWTELNACMGERDASYAVLVVAGEDKVPAGLEELTRVPGQQDHRGARPGGPGPARPAARLPLRPARGSSRRAATSSRSTPPASVTRPRKPARGSSAPTGSASRSPNVTNSAEAAREEFDEIVVDVERCLARIEALVASAAQSADHT